MHEYISYYIEHEQGASYERFVAQEPFEDGFEAPYRKEFDPNRKYIEVLPDEIEPIEK